MTEQKLKEYFDGTLTAGQFSVDLKNSQTMTSKDVTTVSVDQITTGEFEVLREHLIKLCNDTLTGELSPTDLNTIAFAIICSDYFYWDNESLNGKIISDIIFDWDNPDICFDLTFKNIELWKESLLTGIYKLDKDELKEKIKEK